MNTWIIVVVASPSSSAKITKIGTITLTLPARHPLSLLRDELRLLHVLSAEEISSRAAGETGILNLIIWRQLAKKQRRILLGAWAEIQRADGVRHLIVKRLEDHTGLLAQLQVGTRGFH